jgi:hypothetical protein
MYVQEFSGVGENTCQTPVEQEERMCIARDERWQRYRRQSGRNWEYFLTPVEYKYYSDQFTFIREKRPHLYPTALKARNEYRKVAKAFPDYWRLKRAAKDASLSLARSGELVLTVSRESFLKILTDEIAQGVLEEVGDRLSSFIFGANLASLLGVALQLQQMLNSIKNENLLKMRGRAGEEAQFKKKLSLMMDVRAQALAKRYRRNPSSIKIQLWQNYHQFESVWLNYLNYVNLDQSLDPNFPKIKTIRAAL